MAQAYVPPGADIQLWAPGRVSSGLCGAHTGNSMGRGIEWYFPARNCSRVLNVWYRHNRVFSPTLHIQLKSECLSHIVNIFRNARRRGTATW